MFFLFLQTLKAVGAYDYAPFIAKKKKIKSVKEKRFSQSSRRSIAKVRKVSEMKIKRKREKKLPRRATDR